MANPNKLKVQLYLKLNFIDKNILLIGRKMLIFFGFLQARTQPGKNILRKAMEYYVRIFNIYCIFGSIFPIVVNRDLRMFAERINITATFYYGVYISFVFLYNSDSINEFIHEITNCQYAVEISKLRKFKVVVIPYCITILTAFFNIMEAILKGKVTVTEVWLPYDCHSSEIVYYSTSFIMSLSACPVIICVCVGNGFLSTSMILFADLFRSLQKRISKISKIDGELSEIERHRIIRIRFYECIVMHNWILRQFEKSKGTLQVIVTIRCAIMSLAYISCGAVILLELSEHNMAGLSSPVSFLIIITCFSFLYFTISDEMQFESLELSRAWYEADWTGWPRDVRSSLPLALARAQVPVVYRVFGLYDFSLELFLQIVTNCYSFFAFVRERMFA